MFKYKYVLLKSFLGVRFYSLKAAPVKTTTYRSTVLLPKTRFPAFLNQKDIIERDTRIAKEAKFSEFYNWQRNNLKGEYVLHDGPPYANGKPHIGHAVNKILKDIILRSRIIQGVRVHYKPGWDCHGLPIELAALKNETGKLSAIEIRTKAKEVASQMSAHQMKAFEDWGVMADWANQCYYTYDTSYVINELQIFSKLFEKGLIYYALKPVYWSPSSQTALAEAELVYKTHETLSVIARFRIIEDANKEPLYLLIWTTTPWTLPLNKAVYCSPDIKYSVVRISSFPGLYIMATDLIEEVQKVLQADIIKLSEISSEKIIEHKYIHPWHKHQKLDIFQSTEVKLCGTGLLHSVPGHGHEDFIMGLQNNLKVDCFIDERGCYTAEAGTDLAGLKALDEGPEFVLKNLASDILSKEKYQHSYPYDWRTNQPVIIRPSYQWFIDCEQLKERAVKSLENVNVPLEYFKSKLQSRPYWCLSRQRKWGVPIPAFYHQPSGRPLISTNLIQHICEVFQSSGPDAWWTESLDTLFPEKFCNEFSVKHMDVVRGDDIMDIWFDSGVSWSYALDGKKSDLYLEGEDQYSGWFQSSLLTSIAIQDEPSFKRIITHAFVVDDKGRKMSKSVGNVVDPETVLKGKEAFGVDVLRWWVSHHTTGKTIPVSHHILKSESETVTKLRITFRFILGALNGVTTEHLKNYGRLSHIDSYLLNSCYKFYHSVIRSYNSYNIYDVCFRIKHFIPNVVSSRYLNIIKDRLYCDSFDSERRRACQYTLNGILETICYAVAPILPHLAEEVYAYHPLYEGRKKFFYNEDMWSPPEFWNDDSANASIDLVTKLKKEIMEANLKFSEMCCLIQVNEEDFNLLKKMQDGEERSEDSELTEFLQVAEVQLRIGSPEIMYVPKTASLCLRCRRKIAPIKEHLCKRCLDVIPKNFSSVM